MRPHPDWARAGADWPNREASRFLRAGHTDWHLQEMGSGPRLLLLHGAGGASHSWRDLMPLLAEDFRVAAPDLPGHGFTRTGPGMPLTLPAMASEVKALIDALPGPPEVIVGHSAGAAVALRLALDGARPRSVIGLNAALTPFPGLAGLVFPAIAKALALNPAVPFAFSWLAGQSDQAGRLISGTGSRLEPDGIALYQRLFARPSHVSGALRMMANWDLVPLLAELGALPCPVHLIAGSADRAVPPAEARRLAAEHEAISYAEIAGMGHLMHEEDPGQFAAMIRDLARA
ncbi:MAG: alpha/beta fold hydrolase BchO [Pseudomonadota bacterium]